MKVLIVGSPDSGKSKMAEDICQNLSKGDKKIYIATMIPFGIEGEDRVKKHRLMREGKNFKTIECPDNLKDICEKVKDSTCLLECVSNLLGNEMHSEEKLSDKELIDKLTNEINLLGQVSKNLIVVTNEFEIEEYFDEDTIRYCRLLHLLNDSLRSSMDRIIEKKDGDFIEVEIN